MIRRIRARTKVIALVAVAVNLGVLVVLWQISRSRTFQFFGQLIPRVNTSQKFVALTFDDGPTAGATDRILAILVEGLKAYVVGKSFKTVSELLASREQG